MLIKYQVLNTTQVNLIIQYFVSITEFMKKSHFALQNSNGGSNHAFGGLSSAYHLSNSME